MENWTIDYREALRPSFHSLLSSSLPLFCELHSSETLCVPLLELTEGPELEGPRGSDLVPLPGTLRTEKNSVFMKEEGK